MSKTSDAVAAAGRLLIGALFLLSGLSKIAAPAATQAYIAAAGLPAPVMAFAMALLVELLGGVLLIVGFKTRPMAVIVAIFTVATAVVFHSRFADQNQLIHFLKNIAITGGLLQVAAFGGGRWSLDAALDRRSGAAALRGAAA